jgi:nucleotide sugar dehydrogenase
MRVKAGTMKVCIVGLGQIGYPVAQYVKAKGIETFGYDISSDAVARVAKMGVEASADWKNVPKADVYIVSVTTGQTGEGCPDLAAVFDVCKKISQKSAKDTLVTIESTIVPGSSQKIFKEIFRSKIRLAHVPHRFWADEPVKHGVNQLRVVGAVNEESLKAAQKFYTQELGIPLHVCSSVEVAEMCKITENSHRYLQIAFAEDLKMLCAKTGMDFGDLRAAMNTKWNVDLPEARDGIGRHCLPKDIRYVTSLAPSILLDAAMKVDKQYRDWQAKQKQ